MYAEGNLASFPGAPITECLGTRVRIILHGSPHGWSCKCSEAVHMHDCGTGSQMPGSLEDMQERRHNSTILMVLWLLVNAIIRQDTWRTQDSLLN